jgi:DNA-binding SARP family transcriptional activator
LLTRANEVVSTDRLIDELWGAQAPKTAMNALQYHVSQLRKSLAPSEAIVTQEPGYLIRVSADELDLLRFERLLEQAQQSPPELAARLLRDALGLWRGPALADLAHESFAQAEILRLEELRLVALERRIDADLALGRHAELVGELEVLTREHPLRERFRAQLMLALYGSGRQGEALDVYRKTRAFLVDELGIEPSPVLQELEKAILRQDPELSPQADAMRPQRAIVVVGAEAKGFDRLLAIAEPLAREPPRELVLARLLQDHADLAAATATLAERRRTLAQRGWLRVSPRTPRPSREPTPCNSPPGTTSISSSSRHQRPCSSAVVPTRISGSFSSARPATSPCSPGLGASPPDPS